jgi:hypothetical protein
MCLRDSNDAIYFLTETENHLCETTFTHFPTLLSTQRSRIRLADNAAELIDTAETPERGRRQLESDSPLCVQSLTSLR